MVLPPIKPAIKGAPALSMSDWHALADVADGLIVMTYDASSPHRQGPNAPVAWVRDNLEQLLPEEDDRSR